MIGNYEKIRLGVNAIQQGAKEIHFSTGDPVELAAMLEIERHAEEILRMIEKMEEQAEAGEAMMI